MSRELSDAAKKEIAEVCGRYPVRAAATLPALYVAQREFGHIDDEAVAAIARELELPEIKVREVATWYTMYHRRPVGRHHIEVCTNLSCHLRGGGELLECTCRELGISAGETTADGQYTVSEVECLGSCGTAPAVQIDGEFHENLTPEQLLSAVRSAD